MTKFLGIEVDTLKAVVAKNRLTRFAERCKYHHIAGLCTASNRMYQKCDPMGDCIVLLTEEKKLKDLQVG